MAGNTSIEEIDLEEMSKQDVEEKLSTLKALFPDGDTTFLREKAEEFSLCNKLFELFVSNLMESDDYPRARKDSPPPPPCLQVVLSIKLDVDDFLKKYGNPIEHFVNNSTNVLMKDKCLQYLKYRFPKLTVKVLETTLQKQGGSLIKTYQVLSGVRPNRKTTRSKTELSVSLNSAVHSQVFKDEVLTIEHSDLIREALTNKSSQRLEAIARGKIDGSLVQCRCCFDEEIPAYEVLHCDVGHSFCSTCVKRSCDIAMGDGSYVFSCLTECTSKFSISTLEKVLTKSLITTLHVKEQEREVREAGIEGMVYCPFCEYGEIIREGDKVFACKKCQTESCVLCKRLSHIPESCDEVRARMYVEEKMTESLLRTCYKCGTSFVKADGCNKMTCTCGAIMCYICRQPVQNYEHFNHNGDSNDKRCPLFSKNVDLHYHAVLEAGARAKNDAQTQDPNLRLTFNLEDMLK